MAWTILNIQPPQALTDISDLFTIVVDSLTVLLEFSKTQAEIAKAFGDLANMQFAAIEAALDEIITELNKLRFSGLTGIIAHPYKHGVKATYSKNTGTMLLTPKSAINQVIEAFNDEGDIRRPMGPANWGGMVVVGSCTGIEQFYDILKKIGKFFNIEDLIKLSNKIKKRFKGTATEALEAFTDDSSNPIPVDSGSNISAGKSFEMVDSYVYEFEWTEDPENPGSYLKSEGSEYSCYYNAVQNLKDEHLDDLPAQIKTSTPFGADLITALNNFLAYHEAFDPLSRDLYDTSQMIDLKSANTLYLTNDIKELSSGIDFVGIRQDMLFPALDSLISKMINKVEGIKQAIISAKGSLTDIINFIVDQLAEFDEIIEDIIAFIELLQIDLSGKGVVYQVFPQESNTIETIKSGLLADHPAIWDGHNYCVVIGIFGSTDGLTTFLDIIGQS